MVLAWNSRYLEGDALLVALYLMSRNPKYVDIDFVVLQGGADTSTPSWNVSVFHQGELFSVEFVSFWHILDSDLMKVMQFVAHQ